MPSPKPSRRSEGILRSKPRRKPVPLSVHQQTRTSTDSASFSIARLCTAFATRDSQPVTQPPTARPRPQSRRADPPGVAPASRPRPLAFGGRTLRSRALRSNSVVLVEIVGHRCRPPRRQVPVARVRILEARPNGDRIGVSLHPETSVRIFLLDRRGVLPELAPPSIRNPRAARRKVHGRAEHGPLFLHP